MDVLSKAFRKTEGAPALVTFVTAGYPTPNDTVPIMLGMQAGGAGIIELGIPSLDPVADGPTIQESHLIALENQVDFATVLELVNSARKQGLNVPVVLMGYYQSILAYGEEPAIRRAAEVGANGFIVVDIPFRKVSSFRERCRDANIAYVPLVAPNTAVHEIRLLASIADSFIYVISKMGTTGSAVDTPINNELPELVTRVRKHATVPLAVGFGVATREHFETVAAAGADGVVIGSRIIHVIGNSAAGEAAQNVASFCCRICRQKEGLKSTESSSWANLRTKVPSLRLSGYIM